MMIFNPGSWLSNCVKYMYACTIVAACTCSYLVANWLSTEPHPFLLECVVHTWKHATINYPELKGAIALTALCGAAVLGPLSQKEH